jgi:hypothetical protein
LGRVKRESVKNKKRKDKSSGRCENVMGYRNSREGKRAQGSRCAKERRGERERKVAV